MSEILFSDMEAAILYSIPQPGVKLPDLIRYYTFINRDAPPPYEVLAECLLKAAKTGILNRSTDGHYLVIERWYEFIHQFDGQAANEIESLLAFAELFTTQNWPEVAQGYVLVEEDYGAAVSLIQR